jgi:hypothetical protein
LSKTAVAALFAAVFAAVLGVILAPLWNDFWAGMKPAIGAPLVALIGILILVGIAAFSLAVLHYFGVLGAGAESAGTRERKDYDSLRQRIGAGNWIAREYARKLEVFLNAIDHFFGDEGMADRTLFPRAFGLRKSAPLWTAPAFDRCLLLALAYPIVAIVIIWAVSNHVGPAEAALRLSVTDDWRRATVLVAIGLLAFAYWRVAHTKGLRSSVWLVAAGVIAVLSAVALANAGTVAFAAVSLCAVASAPSGAIPVPGAPAVAFAVAFAAALTFAAAMVDAGNGVLVIFVTIAFSCAVAVAFAFAFAQERTEEHGWQGTFLSAFVFVMVLLCFAGAMFLSHVYAWRAVGPLFLFFGLLTLLNAPFDWLSLGLTRALMRRGLEREKWWPYLYALIDALLASAIIAFLAMAIVAGVQIFDDLAVYGGGERVLPPMAEFLDAIRADPGKPEYWWVYATLFSTMLPSLINLFIAGVSLARGVPGVSSWLMGKVREGEAVPAYDRLLVAIVLAFQGVAGLAIAVVAQGFLFWVIIWQGMPRLGIGVLDLAHYVAH